MLGISIILVGARTYQLWQAGPWDLPVAGKPRAAPRSDPANEDQPQFQLASTRAIIDKNLFDPERGTVKKDDAAAKADDQSLQRIKSMVLLGTAILGNSRYAIMQDPSGPGGRSPVPAKAPPPAGPQAPGSGQMRLKLGDTLEGFKLAEIRDRSVLFVKGPNKVEVAIDFFRPGAEPPPVRVATPAAPVPQRPGLAPRVRVPQPGEQAQQAPAPQQDGSSAVERARKAIRDRQLQPPQQPAGRPPEREKAPVQNPQ